MKSARVRLMVGVMSVFLPFAGFSDEKRDNYKWEYIGTFDDGAKVFIEVSDIVRKDDGEVGTLIKIYPNEKRYKQLKEEIIKLHEETERETGFKVNVDVEKVVEGMMDLESYACAVKTKCKFEKLEAFCQNGIFFDIPLPKEDDGKNVYYKIEKFLCENKR